MRPARVAPERAAEVFRGRGHAGSRDAAAATGPPTHLNGGPVSADSGGIDVDDPDGTSS